MRIPIEYVLELDLPDCRKKKAVGNSLNISCPFCGGRYKMNISPTKNVYRCNRCGTGGSAVNLHARLTGTDSSSAKKDLYARYKGLDTDVKVNYEIKGNRDEITDRPYPLELRHDIYTALIKQIRNTVENGLYDAHMNDLLKRGLTREAIDHFGYVSYPDYKKKDFETVSDAMGFVIRYVNQIVGEEQGNVQYHDRFDLTDRLVPGFYKDSEGIFHLVSRKNGGYMIPVRSYDGSISGMQIRHFNDKQHKYSWFSSSEKKTGCGVGNIEQIHHTGFERNHIYKEVFLTEGCLKADIASYLSGKPFIAIVGVNNTSQLEKALLNLKKEGTEIINVALDRDSKTNPYVKKALDKIIVTIYKAGLQCRIVTWDDRFKGIDDYLVNKKN